MAVSIGVVVLEYIGTYILCDYFLTNGHEGSCPFVLSNIETVLLPFLPFFLFSLITYRMKEEVFQAWFRFARIFLPVVLILIAPSYSYNWMFPYDKGMAAIIFSALFSLASIGIITTARMRNK
ncbi:MAG: hypothetical protein WBO66_04385 [Candidatus Moraniibacteriota bacterium]